jgi:hypothetical protein
LAIFSFTSYLLFAQYVFHQSKYPVELMLLTAMTGDVCTFLPSFLPFFFSSSCSILIYSASPSFSVNTAFQIGLIRICYHDCRCYRHSSCSCCVPPGGLLDEQQQQQPDEDEQQPEAFVSLDRVQSRMASASDLSETLSV